VIFGAMQSGAVIPFPLARRRAFVDRHARLISTMRPEAGERHLDRQLSIQAENLRRKRIPSQTIEREVAALGAAIRAAMWRAAWMRGDCT
jgi:prolyl-tRNA editing enzyme YbaK/EbsC (Cys-tRNA(Pro) deacylase)